MDQPPQNRPPSNQPPQDDLESSRRRHRSHNSWWAGLALIVVGLVFLFQNMTGFNWDNWWVLFLLIPVVGILWSAWDDYQKSGNRVTRRLTGKLTGAAFILLVFFASIFNGWGTLWPLFIIISGLSALLYRSTPE